MAALLPALWQGDMARLKLSARSQLELRNALYRAKHVLSRVGQQVQDLDDVLDSLQAAHFVDVVLRDHPPLVLDAVSLVCRPRRWQIGSTGCSRAARSITIGVGIAAGQVTRLGLRCLSLSGHRRWLTDSKAATIRRIRRIVLGSDRPLALLAGPNEVVCELVVEADVQHLDQHCQMLECSR